MTWPLHINRLLFKYKANLLQRGLVLLLSCHSALSAAQAQQPDQTWLSDYQYQTVEPCQKPEHTGNCWALSVLTAIEQQPTVQAHLYQLLATANESLSNDLQPLLQNFQQALLHNQSTGVDAHTLNQLLAVALDINILVIEQHDAGVSVHSISVENEQPVVDLIATAASVNELNPELLQFYLLQAQISLLFTPGHVQPILSAAPQPVLSNIPDTVHLLPHSSSIKLVDFSSAQPGNLFGFQPPVRGALYGSSEGDKKAPIKKLFDERKHAQNPKWEKETRSCSAWSCWGIKQFIAATPLIAFTSIYLYPEQANSLFQRTVKHIENSPVYQNHIKDRLEYVSEQTVVVRQKASSMWKTAQPKLNQFAEQSWQTAKDYAWTAWTGTLSAGCDKNGELVLHADDAGQYKVMGQINGHKLTMLIDSGANSVSISDVVAKRVGLENYHSIGRKTTCYTASTPVSCYAFDHQITVGCFYRKVEFTVRETGREDQILLGTSFLKGVNMETNHFTQTMTISP